MTIADFSLLSADVLPYSVTASSEATYHPATNVAKWRDAFATWRSAAISAVEWLLLDFGSVVPLVGFYVGPIDITNLWVYGSTNGSAYTLDGMWAMPVDWRIGRRQGFCRFAAAISRRYLRLEFDPQYSEAGQTSTGLGAGGFGGGGFGGMGVAYGGQTSMSCGAVVPIRSALALGEAWERPLRFRRADGIERLDLEGGGRAQSEIANPYLEAAISIHATVNAADEVGLQRITETQPIVVVEGPAHPAQAEPAMVGYRVEGEAIEDGFRQRRRTFTVREAVI